MAELRKLSTHCEFGDHLNEALRDRLVWDTDTQRKLLTMASLTLTKALEIAQGAEAAQINSKALKGEDTHLNAVGTECHRCGDTTHDTHLNAVGKECYRCGNNTHDQNDCWYREQDCLHCGKRGHKASVCRSKKRSKPRPPTIRFRQPNDSTYRGHPRNQVLPKDNKYVSTSIDPGEADEASDSEYLALYRVGEATTPPIKVSMFINNKPLTFEVDTGAAVTIMSQTEFQ